MTKSVISQNESKSNRVDPPHDLLSLAEADAESTNLWLAYAGRDPDSMAQQVDRQANELISYVQDQNREIDERQAELNAKLAQLDNQLRNARLLTDESGIDLLADASPQIETANRNGDAIVDQFPAGAEGVERGHDGGF